MTNGTPLEGKLALVTGGGTGIGRAIALGLAGSGARIAVTYRTHEPDEELRTAVQSASGHPLLAYGLDATKPEEIKAAVSAIAREGAIDILVNNAGGLVQRAAIADMEYELWREVLAVNLDTLFLATHFALPAMSDGGRIINVASLAGRNGGHAGATAYAASKAAVFGFTRGLAKEVAARGITVNALAPGFIEATPFHDTFTTADSKAKTVETIPLGRAGNPGDVASAAVWLASDGAGFVSGTVIDVNGAQYFG